MLVKNSYKPLIVAVIAIIVMVLGLVILSDYIKMEVTVVFPTIVLSIILLILTTPENRIRSSKRARVIPLLLLIISLLSSVIIGFIVTLNSGMVAGGPMNSTYPIAVFAPIFLAVLGVWQYIYFTKKR